MGHRFGSLAAIGAAALVVAAVAASAGQQRVARNSQSTAPTYSGGVAKILFDRCAACHRPGEVAPFSLLTFEDARKRSKQIAEVVKNRTMPPWKAESHGEFRNERWLTDEEIAAVTSWAERGAPVGDARKIPEPPKFSDTGWRIGTPDRIVSMPEPYKLSAEGRDEYRCFVIPADLAEDRYLAAMEFKPGNRKVVHHVIAYLDTSGAARKLDEKDPGPGYASSGGGPGFIPAGMLSGWAPGNEPSLVPDGAGMRLPKGSDIVLEVHYNKSGKAETDLTSVGLKYTTKPVEKLMRLMVVVNGGLNIPPGEASYRISAASPVNQSITVYGVTPHMHLLGREMEVTAEMADGSKKRLVRVPDWDFNWQTFYEFKEPVKVPAGSKLSLTARYDNSAANPRNPNNPPKAVRWGEQTADEMCIAFVAFTIDSEDLTRGVKAKKASLFEIGAN